MKKRLVDLIDKSGMVETRSRCEIIADELLAAGVCFAPVEIVIRKDITDDMLRQVQNALAMPAMIMPYDPGQEIVEIVPRWIPVTERLPEKEGRYIVINESGNVFDAYYDENIVDECQFGEWVQMFDPVTLGVIDSEWRSYEEITHWMHLPELPEEVQK